MIKNEPLKVIAANPDAGRLATMADVINELDGEVVSQNYNEVCTVGFDDLRRWLIVLQREQARYQLLPAEPIKPETGNDITIEGLLSDMSVSFWLKDALKTALTRDPIDAARDAELLSNALGVNALMILNRSY